MNNNLLSLKPELVWKHFSKICSLPHPSGHEEKIREYIVSFAKEHNIECIVDEAGNVILRKPATPGMENRKGIIMQGHMDMVPQKNSNKQFDFEKDPIAAYIDGEWVTADGTTLGADNGMGEAAALAVMEDDTIPHGPLEALFTINEESGMDGAFALKPGVLKGDILLNLDSEEEGELYVGCAGGLDVVATLPYKREAAPGGVTYGIHVSGLKGGHSGLEIILQRANSNKLMFRFLYHALQNLGVSIVEVNGGNMRNAIPREASATVVVPADKSVEFEASVKAYEKMYKSEFSEVDEGLSFVAEKMADASTIIDRNTAARLVNVIYACPNGVARMSDSMKGLVETSSNLGVVVTKEDVIEVVILVRSSVDSAKDSLTEQITAIFTLAGATVSTKGGYSGWKPNLNSPILKTMQKVYQELYGKVPAIMAIHAGLECGILGGTYPNLDMISFGPTLKYPHSPDEKVNIESVGKFYEFLVETIKNAPLK